MSAVIFPRFGAGKVPMSGDPLPCFEWLRRRIDADLSPDIVFLYGISDSALNFGSAAVVQIKDLENQLVEEKKARSQLTFANETSRSFQPSFKQRPPLARITNRLPPLAPPHKIVKTGLENMENARVTTTISAKDNTKEEISGYINSFASDSRRQGEMH